MAKTYLRNCRILPGDGSVIENGLVVVNNVPSEGKLSIKDRIEYVGPADGYTVDPEAEVYLDYDLEGYTVMPGLVDASARLDINVPADPFGNDMTIPFRTLVSFRHAAEALNCGVTAVKIAGMPDRVDLALKNAMTKLMFQGPAVISSGPEYIPHGGKDWKVYGTRQCSGVNEFLGAARVENSVGIQSIRIGVSGAPVKELGNEPEQQMKDDEIKAMVWLGGSGNRVVTAVVTGDKAVGKCADFGVQCVEMSEGFTKETAEKMAEKGMFYVPCLNVAENLEARKEAVKTAKEAGLTVCLGTYRLPSEPVDGTVAVIKELELLVEAGLSPLEALQAATANSAKLCRTGTGVLAEGKTADIIAVKGRPDEDIKAMRQIDLIIRNGRLVNSNIGKNDCRFRVVPVLFGTDGGSTHNWL